MEDADNGKEEALSGDNGKWDPGSGQWITTDLEDFNKDTLRDKVKRATCAGWFVKKCETVEATDNQVATGIYLGMIPEN